MKAKVLRRLAMFLTVAMVAALLVMPVAAVDPTTDAQVEFIAGELEFPDVDEDGDPIEGGTPPTLDFGVHKMTTDAFFSEIDKDTDNTPDGEGLRGGAVIGSLVIHDGRGSVTGGYKLNLKLDRFKSGTEDVFKGAKVTISTDGFTSKSSADGLAGPQLVGTGAELTSGATDLTPFLTTAAGQGLGTWEAKGADGKTTVAARLDIPNGANVSGAVTADLTWTLETTP